MIGMGSISNQLFTLIEFKFRLYGYHTPNLHDALLNEVHTFSLLIAAVEGLTLLQFHRFEMVTQGLQILIVPSFEER